MTALPPFWTLAVVTGLCAGIAGCAPDASDRAGDPAAIRSGGSGTPPGTGGTPAGVEVTGGSGGSSSGGSNVGAAGARGGAAGGGSTGSAADAGARPDGTGVGADQATADARPAAPSPVTGTGNFFMTSVPPTNGAQYASADFSLFVPDGVTRLRGLVVHQHGCGRGGITMPYDVHWQALAARWGFALMGTHFRDRGNCGQWSAPANGSEAAFLAAIAAFATATKHAELAQAPWVLWGHSGGANWVVSMTQRFPERVVATVAKSFCGSATATAAMMAVPVLFVTGPGDIGACLSGSTNGFVQNRAKGAVWALAVDPKGAHGAGHQRLLAIPYLDAVMSARLPDAAPASGPTALRAVSDTGGWLGNPMTLEVSASGSYTGNKLQAVWMPGEDSALRWQQFGKTGTVKDSSAPVLAPADLKAQAMGTQVMLTWSAVADLESGIKSFFIYRDGTRVGMTMGPSNNYNRGFFQYGNFGDEPDPARPVMGFTDASAPAGAHRYEVSTVNWSDLESPRSAAATSN